MRMREFVLIIALKLFAILIIVAGIICEVRNNCSVGNLAITVGSLVFAIASNTTLFMYTSVARRRRKEVIINEYRTRQSTNGHPATYHYPVDTVNKGRIDCTAGQPGEESICNS